MILQKSSLNITYALLLYFNEVFYEQNLKYIVKNTQINDCYSSTKIIIFMIELVVYKLDDYVLY